jgi:hypothetical protein
MARHRADRFVARTFLFTLIALFIAQSVLAGHAAAHSLGACPGHARSAVIHEHAAGDHAAPHSHEAPAAHDHRHAGDHAPDSAPASGHDHVTECCGWMCTAALCTVVASLAPRIPPAHTASRQVSDVPVIRLASGLDRPPRLPLGTI